MTPVDEKNFQSLKIHTIELVEKMMNEKVLRHDQLHTQANFTILTFKNNKHIHFV